jgi:hypothetical protein
MTRWSLGPTVAAVRGPIHLKANPIVARLTQTRVLAGTPAHCRVLGPAIVHENFCHGPGVASRRLPSTHADRRAKVGSLSGLADLRLP